MATDLVTIFTDYATSKGWRSSYVTLQDKEFQVTSKDLTAGEYILLIFPFAEVAVLDQTETVEFWRATTRIWLGRKFDNTSTTGTVSSIDETLEQKDDRRLATIRATLKTMVKDLFCAGVYDMISADITLEFNVTNESLDFVVLNVSFKAP